MNAPAPMGHNAPPDPFTLYAESIDDLILEAGNFLDGTPIESDAQAGAVASILTRLRRELGAADDQRKAEKKPHDDAGKAVQAKWAPLLSRATLALDTARNAMAAFLTKKDEAQRAAAKAAQQEAEEQAKAAAQARANANPESLSDQATLREAENAAQEAARRATRLEKAKPQAKGGERAVGLRAAYRAEIVDPLLFGKWAWEHRRDEYLKFLGELAERECRHGPKDLPGITVHEDKRAA